MEFSKSTQARNWMFTPEKLDMMRHNIYEEGKKKYGTKLSYEQYNSYIQYYADKLIQYANNLPDWSRFQRYTALTLYKRVYLNKSIWDIPPPLAVINAIHLVYKFYIYYETSRLIQTMKVEQSIIDRFHPHEQLARTEIIFLDGIHFNLKLHLPFHHLEGLANNELSPETFAQCSDRLMELLQTDALFLYTPSEIAYAAVYSIAGSEFAHHALKTFDPPIDPVKLDNVVEAINSLQKEPYDPSLIQSVEDEMAPEFTAAEVLQEAESVNMANQEKSMLPPKL